MTLMPGGAQAPPGTQSQLDGFSKSRQSGLFDAGHHKPYCPYRLQSQLDGFNVEPTSMLCQAISTAMKSRLQKTLSVNRASMDPVKPARRLFGRDS
jgi:hypothetical protein